MNTRLINLLMIICSVSVLIILLEWGVSHWMQKVTLESLVAIEVKDFQDEIPHIDLDKRTEESYVDLVERPLFIKGRHPAEEINVVEAQMQVVPAVFEWQLNGVYSTKKGFSAFLCHLNAKNVKDKYRKISKDEVLDGWRLTEIYEDKVVFSQGEQQKELFLRKIRSKNLSSIQNRPKKLPVNTETLEEDTSENSNE